MKKNMDWVRADSDLLQWCAGKLREAPFPRAAELGQAMASLAQGTSESLIVEREEKDTPSPREEHQIVCGELSIDTHTRRVVMAGRDVSLTPKEYDILCFLARNRGEVFTKEQIYQAVWEDSYLLDDSNIMAFIRKLRKKIEPEPDAPRYILTIWGIGYKFNENP